MSYINSLIFFLFILLSGCTQEGSESSLVSSKTTNASVEVTVSSIRVYCSELNIQTGTSCNLTTLSYLSNGQIVDVTDEAEYSVEDEAIITQSAGVVSAISSGNSKVYASYSGASSDLTLLTFTANISSVEINKSDLTLSSDGEYQLEAFVFYDNGMTSNITSEVIWVSDDPTVASVDEGNVISLSEGSTSISIDYEGFTDQIVTTVSSETISSLQVTPVLGSEAIGTIQQFYATAILSDTTSQDFTETVTWSSSDSSVLSISESGLASLITEGEVSITASYGSFSTTVNFSVSGKTITSLTILSDSDSISLTSSLNMRSIATYDDGSEEEVTDSALWEVNNSTLATISNGIDTVGLLTPMEIGEVIITSTVGGVSSSKTISITNSTLDSISLEPSSTLLSSGIDSRLKAIGNYSDGSSVDITHLVTWDSSDSSLGVISNITSSKGYFTNNYTGSSITSLSFSATLDGIVESGNIIITPGSINSISISQGDFSTNTNKNRNLKSFAHFADGASVEITELVIWSSTDQSVAFISNSISSAGLLSSLTEGVATITAYYKGFNSENVLVNVSDIEEETTTDIGTGLNASYFSGNNFNSLAGERIDSTINFNWARGMAPLGVGDNFSVRWTGKIMGKVSGYCTITSRSDDGFRVYIGGNSIIDVWFAHAPRWDSTHNVEFIEGEKQDITVEFFENGGQAVAELYWECDGDVEQEVIPKEYLFTE